MAKVVFALVGCELVKQLAAGSPEGFDRSFGSALKQPLELGECLLDRVEVRAVWRQVNQRCASGFDGFTHSSSFVAGKVIHDDQVMAA